MLLEMLRDFTTEEVKTIRTNAYLTFHICASLFCIILTLYLLILIPYNINFFIRLGCIRRECIFSFAIGLSISEIRMTGIVLAEREDKCKKVS